MGQKGGDSNKNFQTKRINPQRQNKGTSTKGQNAEYNRSKFWASQQGVPPVNSAMQDVITLNLVASCLVTTPTPK